MSAVPAASLTADPGEAIASIRALAGIDGAGLLRAVEAIPPDTYLTDAATVLGWIEPYAPELAAARSALLILALIVRGYETGAIKSADPQDPAMRRESGQGNFSS